MSLHSYKVMVKDNHQYLKQVFPASVYILIRLGYSSSASMMMLLLLLLLLLLMMMMVMVMMKYIASYVWKWPTTGWGGGEC